MGICNVGADYDLQSASRTCDPGFFRCGPVTVKPDFVDTGQIAWKLRYFDHCITTRRDARGHSHSLRRKTATGASRESGECPPSKATTTTCRRSSAGSRRRARRSGSSGWLCLPSSAGHPASGAYARQLAHAARACCRLPTKRRSPSDGTRRSRDSAPWGPDRHSK